MFHFKVRLVAARVLYYYICILYTMTCACVALILSVGAERQLAMTAITHTQEAVCITYQT